MAAQQSSSKSKKNESFFSKDLFIFIAIMAIVAVMTYYLTINAINVKVNDQINESNEVQQQTLELPQE